MLNDFWKQLKKPIFVLAPMADVTDAAFRRLIAKYAKPDVMWTEFVSCEGLLSEGKEKLLTDLIFDDCERPIVAQIFGNNPDHFFSCAKLIADLGFDGIDINMGCPDKNICKQKAGAYLICDPDRVKRIISETKRGAPHLPVSVKTRLGLYQTQEMYTWIPVLLDTDISCLTVHLRTKKEMSKVDAHWELMHDIVRMRNEQNPSVLILGNGDVKNIAHAQQKVNETQCDGIMLGRAIFGNPWLFHKQLQKEQLSLQQQLEVLCEHTFLFEELLGGKKHFALMKKHYKAYVQGFEGATKVRDAFMQANNAKEVQDILRSQGLIPM